MAQLIPKALGREVTLNACLHIAVVSLRLVVELTAFAVADHHFTSVVIVGRAAFASVEAGAEVAVAERGGRSLAVRVVAGDVKHLVRVPRIGIVRGIFA